MQLRPKRFICKDIVEFFVNLKLNHRIIRGKLKEHGILRYEQGSAKNTQIGKCTIGDTFEHQISERINFYSTGSRADLIDIRDGFTYEEIAAELCSWSLDDSTIQDQVKHILQTGEASIEEIWQRDYLYDFTHLLFCNETERSAASFLTNALFLELVASNVYAIKDLPKKLPMSISKSKSSAAGAVRGSRHILDYLGGHYGEKYSLLSKREYYDFGPTDQDKAVELATRNTALFLDWLMSKKLVDDKEKVEYIDANKRSHSISLKEATTRIYNYSDTLNLQPTNKYAEQTRVEIALAINKYLYDMLSNKINPSSTEQKNSTLQSKIFESLYDLVYEWYVIKLDYLCSSKKDLNKEDSNDGKEKEKKKVLVRIPSLYEEHYQLLKEIFVHYLL